MIMSSPIYAGSNSGASWASLYLKTNNDAYNQAVEALASGTNASNPANGFDTAIGYEFGSQIGILQQAGNNVTQASAMVNTASSVLGESQSTLIQLQQLAVQANSGTLDAAQMGALNQTYQGLLGQLNINATSGSSWQGGPGLLSGGPGTYTASGAVVADSINNAGTPTANTISGFNAATATGLISGVVSSASVTAAGMVTVGGTSYNSYAVSLQVGNQTFQGNAVQMNSGSFTLTSTTNPSDTMSFNFSASTAGITDATTFQNSLNSYFNLSTGGAATSFTSSSAPLPATISSVGLTSGVAPGNYSLSYQYDAPSTTGQFVLSNGQNTYTATLSAPSTTVSQSVTFGNGLSLNLSSFNGQSNMSQNVFNVSGGSSQTYSVQTGINSSNVTSFTLQGASASALGLSGSNISTAGGAASAVTNLSNAVNQVSSQIGYIGGVSQGLDISGNNIQSQIQNLTAAQSTFTNTDVASTMLALQNSQALSQLASYVYTQAINNKNQLINTLTSSLNK
jgi:flagellin